MSNSLEKALDAREHTKIDPKFPYAYYTCVRPATDQKHHVSIGKDVHEVTIKYQDLPWHCMKGWYEFYDNHPGGVPIETKVVKYCRFSNEIKAVEKAIGVGKVIMTDWLN
jgi:hypothetical protein